MILRRQEIQRTRSGKENMLIRSGLTSYQNIASASIEIQQLRNIPILPILVKILRLSGYGED